MLYRMTHHLYTTQQMELGAIQTHIISLYPTLPPTLSNEIYLLFIHHQLTQVSPSVYKNRLSSLYECLEERRKRGTGIEGKRELFLFWRESLHFLPFTGVQIQIIMPFIRPLCETLTH